MKRVALVDEFGLIRMKQGAALEPLNSLFPEGIPVRRFPLAVERHRSEVECFEIDMDRCPSTKGFILKLARLYAQYADEWLLEAISRNSKGISFPLHLMKPTKRRVIVTSKERAVFPVPVNMAAVVGEDERLDSLTKKAIAHLKLKRRMEVRGLAWSLGLRGESRELKAVIQRLEELGIARFRRDYGYYARYVDLVVLLDGGQAA